ncbi:uncharacterized protein SEPMUDRAFT_151133 [Sphaerulina musiva SO2202]|uniref:Uncharacterized protein n=1 Tax=Sphaerulina musiva (strain SO2202) TaxID=692275 RepID=M3CCG2_SPHMS|nr:uncharacterized protein SEPMUDRAFT_151133 [Sphaerulina musiva SO2202]EMF10082.1 hypothetical protein SEPMUDRAFT_151133 [Sphaerulina musiva SO2202]
MVARWEPSIKSSDTFDLGCIWGRDSWKQLDWRNVSTCRMVEEAHAAVPNPHGAIGSRWRSAKRNTGKSCREEATSRRLSA